MVMASHGTAVMFTDRGFVKAQVRVGVDVQSDRSGGAPRRYVTLGLEGGISAEIRL